MEEETNVYAMGERNIYLAGEINTRSISETCTKLIASIINIMSIASKIKGYEVGHINLHILSTGGSLHDMWALVDYILNSPVPIYTYATGIAASAAVPIFLAGHKRYIMEHTTLMYHELSCGNNDKLQNLSEWNGYLMTEQKKVEDFIKLRTLMKPKKIKEIREKKIDFYMSADEAIALNFATNKFECRDWGNIICG